MYYDKLHLLKDFAGPGITATSAPDFLVCEYRAYCGRTEIAPDYDCPFIEPDRLGGYNPDCICKKCKKALAKEGERK